MSRLLPVMVVCLALAGCGEDSPGPAAATPTPSPSVSPSPTPTPEPGPYVDEPLPDGAAAYADAISGARERMREAARAWDGKGAIPEALALNALYDQRMLIALVDRRALSRRVLRELPAAERGALRDDVLAHRRLKELSSGWTPKAKSEYRTGRAEDAATLWGFYGEGRKRFRTTRNVLAAVNYVETSFNKLRSNSVSGAQGPMQFIPSTWAAYGLGGNIRDPHDAILGAANYLHANGAPGDNARALYRYNPSTLYVEAVRRLARRMRTEAGFRMFYARNVFVRKPGGGRVRLTGPKGPKRP